VGSGPLYDDALNMSINKSLDDVVTAIQWASEADDPQEKLRHIEHALELLVDVRENLRELGGETRFDED
jgi:hypothetical protein